jgi:hypothetical protein
MLSFRLSAEFDTFVAGIAGGKAAGQKPTSLDYYVGLMGRLPDSGGFDYWLACSAQCAAGASTLVWGIMNSTTSQFISSASMQVTNRTDSEFVTIFIEQ